jgi:hypothetical protein
MPNRGLRERFPGREQSQRIFKLLQAPSGLQNRQRCRVIPNGSPYQNRIKTLSVEPIEVAARAKSRCPKLLKSQRTP